MGYKLATESQKTFVTFFNGRMKINVKEGTEGSVQRVNKNGKTVHEVYLSEIFGYLISIKKRPQEGDFKDTWAVCLKDPEDGSIMQLELPYSSSQTNGLFTRLPKIDFSYPIVIKTGRFEADERNWLTVEQNGAKLERFWTKENPGDLPRMKKVMVNGKPTWDATEMMDYFGTYINTIVQPALEKLFGSQQVQPNPALNTQVGGLPPSESQPQPQQEIKREPSFPNVTVSKVPEDTPEEDDDLPF